MLTLKKLQVFVNIARLGNLTAAADELCLSKAAVSQALTELENQLNVPLFDRVHPRLKLNDQGRQLQPLADELLTRASEIEQLFSSQMLQGQLRLGASQTIGNYLLPALLSRLPQGQTKVFISNSYNLCQKLLQFELDLALIEGENPYPELVTVNWLEDEMYLLASPAHPLAQQQHTELSNLNGQPWVLREPQSGSREQFDYQLAPLLQHCGNITELNTLEAVMKAVEAGIGLTLISAHAAADRLRTGQLVRLALPQRFSRQLKLIWHRQKYHSALQRHFISLCHEETASISSP
ncbi:LysR substrate-binding domain-containing protein [Chromatiaceae bacterium AAb-1]|nr:LysR substrate-binding domain-containing protein [Chromatiaceae bacterium AAb-1]